MAGRRRGDRRTGALAADHRIRRVGAGARAMRSLLARPLGRLSQNPTSLAVDQYEFDVQVFHVDGVTCSEVDKFLYGE